MKYPNSRVIGIDLAEKQIEIGQQMLQEVGMNNIQLFAGDITNIEFDNVQFDYIICHGVFSWVPESVQYGILNTVEKYLSPNGLAYISYNTYPGWHLKDMAKELMLFGSNSDLDRASRVPQSLELLKYTKNIISKKNTALYPEINNMFNDIINKPQHYIAHEYFENYNIPLYFKDFIQKIEQYNLAYVTDSSTPNIRCQFIFTDEEYQQICQYFNNKIEKVEQYTDFITNRKFRTSIITKKENIKNNDIRQYDLCHNFFDIYLKTNVEYINDSDKNYWQIKGDNLRFSSNSLVDKLMMYLQEKTPVNIQSLFKKLENESDYNDDTIKDVLFHIIHSDNTYLCYKEENLKTYDEKPHISQKLRNLIAYLTNNPNITTTFNQFNSCVELGFLAEYLSQYMDGTRTINDLITIVRKDIEEETITWKINDKELKNAEIEDKTIESSIKLMLEELYMNGFFNEY
ncbi:hypothetical protein A6A11_07870 [Bisgaardia hudsonensis]|nr:hypothetical protein A6A11_07870 [Bisgaardia hudsonensis]